MKRFALLALVVLFAFCSAGCGSVQKQYVDADRLTYNAVVPRQKKYLDADTTLSPEDKEAAQDVLNSWDVRLKAAEGK